MSSIGVAVISYNTRELLRSCLASAVADGAVEVVVADNGSTDGSIEMVRAEFPQAVLLVDRSNPGYGGASNAAIAACRAEYVLLLNSDTVLRPGALASLRRYLDDHPRAAIVGPRLLNPDGTLQSSIHQFPSPVFILYNYSWVGPFLGKIPLLRRLHRASGLHDRVRVVNWVMGAALAIRKPAFDAVGGFDRSFFMYYEEVDLSYRLHLAGWETHFAPVTEVTHVGGASTSRERARMYAQQIAAAIQYAQRHHSEGRVRQTEWALRFSMRSRIITDSVRYWWTRDHSERERLAEDIGMWRTALGRARRPITR